MRYILLCQVTRWWQFGVFLVSTTENIMNQLLYGVNGEISNNSVILTSIFHSMGILFG